MIDTSKIIHAPINGSRYTETAPLWKEHYGIYLKIEGADLPETYEVDFSNDEFHGTSVTMIGNADGVLIPHQFIDTGKDVFAFLYWVGEDFGKTVYKIKIPNRFRPDRTNEQPTPEQQSVIDQAIAALNDAVEQTAQDVIDADASAQSASADADRASANANFAHGYAEQAEQSAQNAHASALQASASATASAQSAEQSAINSADAQDSAEEAQGYAQSASQSATASANSASQASASATSASQSATIASGYATSAQSSAQTASAKASEASTSASTASAKATEASQSATTASNKATEASGYATSASQAKTDAESARDSAQGYASDAQGYANDAQASAESISASASQIAKNTADILKTFPTDTASGSVASFTDGADGIPLKSLIVNIEPVQSGTGDPSPDNVRPISGWTGMQLSVNGTVIPISWQTEAGTVYGGTLDVLSGVLTVDQAMITKNTALMDTTNDDYPGWFNSGIKSLIGAGKNTSNLTGVINIGQKYGANTNGVNDTLILPRSIYGKTKAEWVALALDVQIVATLATPIEIQLTPHEVNSLLGVNNIWADTGDTEVEYRADPDLYIQRKLPEVPVDDVQINGTSIVSDGVANVPIGGASTLGVVSGGESNGYYGLTINGSGALRLAPADSNSIKAGTGTYRPVVSAKENEAVFFGLAKSAGDTTQSQSSNAVGNYTEEAKIAIQKMLGIYEAPWELLNEFTLDEEEGFDLTTDDNGIPYDLRDVLINVYYPANLSAVTVGYARYLFYDDDNHFLVAETGKYSASENYMYKYIKVERNGNLTECRYTDRQPVGGAGTWKTKNMNDSGNSTGFSIIHGNIKRIKLHDSDKEPAGITIKIYGRRAY